jgi:UDP-N-acetylmuramoyl-tripeptide--D-alanyl-D-alanine ligase
MKLPVSKVAAILKADFAVAPANPERTVCGITWDSREVQPGYAYVALPGERVDGHTFIASALEKGAACAIAMQEPSEEAVAAAKAAEGAIIMVPDTFQAFPELARGWREYLTGTVLALTGSMGKTTTKNLVRDVLATTLSGTATKANQNNELGVPRTVLDTNAKDQFVVVEMGMRGLGQISHLVDFVRPSMALITNVAECHLELLGSKENIARAKSEVLETLEAGSACVLNAADAFTQQICKWQKLNERGIEVLLFDGSGNAQPQNQQLTAYATDIQLDEQGQPAFTLHLPEGAFPCKLGLRGAHNVNNACAAAAVAWRLGVPAQSIVAGLAGAQAESGRQEVVCSKSGITVMNDAYNANPDSMCASLAVLCAMEVSGRRYAVLGDMGELGSYTEEGHKKAGAFVASSKVDFLICVGELSCLIAESAKEAGFPQENILQAKSREEALAYLTEHAVSGDAVLVKASHSMELDRIAKGLLN